MTLQRGEIWRAHLPTAPGHTQSGTRPVLVVQSSKFSLPTTLIIPFTSTLAATKFAGTRLIQPSPGNGLSLPSVALVFQLRALDNRDFDKKLGQMSAAEFADLFALLDELLER
jgi:mRNA interferase MazF